MTDYLTDDPDNRVVIVQRARDFLGVRFRDQGRTRHGIDCLGLLALAYKPLLRFYDELQEYPRRPSTAGAFEAVKRRCDHIDEHDAVPGDVVQMNCGGPANHFGLLTELGLIHASLAFRRVVEHSLVNGLPGGQIVAFYKVRVQ